MREVRFICRKCGERFTKNILEEGEAEDKELPYGPVRCPKCGSTEVERA